MSLEDYGWSPRLAEAFEPYADRDLLAGRVVREQRGEYRVLSREGELVAKPTGRLRHHAGGGHDLPAVGDWVAVRRPSGPHDVARIHAILPRNSSFSRKVAGVRTKEQVVAANVDRVFIVMGLDGDFSLRRLERYLATARESGAEPVVVLNKADLHPDPESARTAVEAITGELPVLVISCLGVEGVVPVERLLRVGETVALVGSSGVGKSTLINLLYGEEVMRTGAVRSRDERGIHTTSHRQLLRLPSGALLIDNPGIRELQLWQAESGLEATFADIEEIGARCRFRNCTHEGEPGCAVAAAIEEGELAADRLASYRNMQQELAHLRRRQDENERLAQKRRWRTLHRAARKHRPRSM